MLKVELFDGYVEMPDCPLCFNWKGDINRFPADTISEPQGFTTRSGKIKVTGGEREKEEAPAFNATYPLFGRHLRHEGV